MSHYSQGEFDFVKRTIKIIGQYDKLNHKNTLEKYEVTLLINCFLGLIVVPQQLWLDKINSKKENRTNLLLNIKYIGYIKDDYNIKNVITHFRNSAAHGKIQPRSKDKGKKKKITHLMIQDFEPKKFGGKKTFEALVPIEIIKSLSLSIGKEMIKVMENYR